MDSSIFVEKQLELARKVRSGFRQQTLRLHISVSDFVYRNSSAILFTQALILVICGLTNLALAQENTSTSSTEFDDTYIKDAICKVIFVIEGSFGALLMLVAGLAGIVSAAIGAYKAAMNCIVIACGSWIIRSFVTLYFGKDVFGDDCKTRDSVKSASIE